MTIQPFKLLFNTQVMILVGSSGFFNLASASVDGCYLDIIIHYDILQRDWGIRSAPRDGRPDPESFKAIVTYTYRKIILIVPMHVPGCVRIVHMRGGSSSSSLMVND